MPLLAYASPLPSVVPVAYSATGGGAQQGVESTNAIGWSHTIGATDSCIVAGVTGYYSSGGHSSWTRTCGIVSTPVAWDSTGTTGITNASHTGGTAQTYTHTVSSGGNVTAVVALGVVGNSTNPWSFFAPTAITFGGHAMTLSFANGNANIANATGFIAIYTYSGSGLNGAQTVSIKLPNTGSWWAVSAAYTGVGLVEPGNATGSTQTSQSTFGFPSVLGGVTLAAIGTLGTTVTAASSTIRGGIQSAASGCESGCLQEAAGTSSTVTQTQTATASTAYAACMVTLVPVISTSFTSLGVIDGGNTTPFGWTELFGYVGALPSGATTILARETFGNNVNLVGNSVSYTGVASFGTAVTDFGSGTAITSNSVTLTLGDMVVAAQGVYDQTVSAPSGTQRVLSPSTATTSYTTLLIQDVAGSSTATLTATTGSGDWGSVAVDLIANH